MPKLDYLQQKKLSPADELRDILASLEERQLKIRTLDTDQSLNLLRDLDKVDTLFQQLEVAGLDLLAEQGRFNSIQARLEKQAAALLRSLGGAATLSARRPQPPPPPEKWWWYIDQQVAAQQRRLWRRLIISLVIALVVLGGIVLLFQTVLAPSPEVVARLEAENEAYAAIDAGNYKEAVAVIERGLAKVPADPNLLTLKGVVQEILGEQTAAAQSFEQAQAGLNNRFDVYMARSQVELRVGQGSKAERSARAALELDPDSGAAWLLLGQALELQDKRFEAIPAYEKAAELALASGDHEVVILARLALGRIGASP
jgi:tetratricopeptide (TPR) repeat protein